MVGLGHHPVAHMLPRHGCVNIFQLPGGQEQAVRIDAAHAEGAGACGHCWPGLWQHTGFLRSPACCQIPDSSGSDMSVMVVQAAMGLMEDHSVSSSTL